MSVSGFDTGGLECESELLPFMGEIDTGRLCA